MKLFTIGPVEMYPSTQIVRAKGFPHFRTDEYSNVVKKTLKKLVSTAVTKYCNAMYDFYRPCIDAGLNPFI